MKKFEIKDKTGVLNTLFATTIRGAKNWCRMNGCTLEKEVLTFKIS